MASSDEQARYQRQLLLPEIGAAGQERLGRARVLVVGAGGLGSPVCLYLAAAGVGAICLVDPDQVELSNLQRQVLYCQADLGRPKVVCATEHLRALNPAVAVRPVQAALTSGLAASLVAEHDVVVDACDSIETRLVMSRACIDHGKPLVYGAVDRLHGQASLLWPPHGPCYRCLFPEPGPESVVPETGPAGVLGTVAGLIGMVQANEVIKLLTGFGSSLLGRLLLLDGQTTRINEIEVARDPACPLCAACDARS